MISLPRHLPVPRVLRQGILLSAALLLPGPLPSARAAVGDAPPPAVFRALAVERGISQLHYDLAGKPITFSARIGSLSPPCKLPETGRLVLYKRVPSAKPGEPPKKVVLAEEHVGTEGPYLILLAYAPPDPATGARRLVLRVIDDSWKAHPPESVRVLNLSARRTAIQFDTATLELASGEFRLFSPMPDTGVVDFKAAAMENGTWSLRVQLPQALYRRTRQTFLIKDTLPSEENPRPVELNITNIVDTAQPPQDTQPAPRL